MGKEVQLKVEFRPEAGLRTHLRAKFADKNDRRALAQWLMEEGSVSVAYSPRDDYTEPTSLRQHERLRGIVAALENSRSSNNIVKSSKTNDDSYGRIESPIG